MAALRLAFFGLPLAASLLARDGHELVSVVLSPVGGPGRRRLRRLLPPTVPLLDLLEEPRSLEGAEEDPRIDRLLERVRPDLIVSWFWTRRLTGSQLARARLGGVGAHPSLLPRHRGPNPYFAAIDAGDALTGVTIHRLTEAYDEGNILAQESLPVGDSDAWQLARRLDRPSLRQLRRVVRHLAEGTPLEERPQDESAATWAPEPTGDLLRIDFRWSTERVLRRVRALSPVPGLALEFDGVKFFVLAAAPTTDYPAALLPGEGALVGSPPEVVIRTGDGAFRVLRAQLADPAPDSANPSEIPTEDDDEDRPIVSGQELAEWVARR